MSAYDMRISDWSSDVCSSDLLGTPLLQEFARLRASGRKLLRTGELHASEVSAGLCRSAVRALRRVIKLYQQRSRPDTAARLKLYADHSSGNLRSEEHTSELQSLMRISYAVFCLKKKNIITLTATSTNNLLNTPFY